jgi:glycosyltransferase involved in cell wall biosynthesis
VHVVVLGGFAPSLIVFRGPLLAAMVARGHRVTTMAADGTSEIRTQLAALGVDYEEVALERAGTRALADLATVASLRRRLRELAPDVLFAYTIKPVVYGHLAARFAGVPRRFAMVTGLGYAFLGQDRLRRRILRRVASALYRGALAGADGLFVQNPDDERDLRAAGALPSGLPITQVRGSGVDVDHYAVAPLPPAPPLVFLYIGRLIREKGFGEFVEMARRVRASHPGVRFRAIGWIDPNPASVGRGELDRWIADGVIDYGGVVADVRPELARAHVLVLPSYREGTPRSVLEAMSMGRPVITTDVPGCRETIVDGEHGFLVPARDPDALVRAAAALIAEPRRIGVLGARARARVEELYDARKVASRMLDVMGL